MANKYMKRYLTLLVIKKMQVKTIFRHHYIPVSMGKKKKKTPDF